jgi:hypothetical protein
MPRRLLSHAKMIAGVEAALRSRRTPAYLKPALRRRLAALKKGHACVDKGSKKSQVGFLGWLQF